MELAIILICLIVALLGGVVLFRVWHKNKKRGFKELDKTPSDSAAKQPVDLENYVDPGYSIGRTVGGDCGQHGN